MLLGVALAFSVRPGTFAPSALPALGLALAATCLIASSNYVLNELLDARTDRHHPTKRLRPVASGATWTPLVLIEWLGLGAAGGVLAWRVNEPFAWTAGILWVMGLVYNVPPVRSKDVPYLDVLSESLNNPLRLALGGSRWCRT